MSDGNWLTKAEQLARGYIIDPAMRAIGVATTPSPQAAPPARAPAAKPQNKPSDWVSASEGWSLFKGSKLMHPIDNAMRIIQSTPEFVKAIPDALTRMGQEVTPDAIKGMMLKLAVSYATKGQSGPMSMLALRTVPAGLRGTLATVSGKKPGQWESSFTGVPEPSLAQEDTEALKGLTYQGPKGPKMDWGAVQRYMLANPEAPAWAVAKLAANVATAGEATALTKAIDALEASNKPAYLAWKAAQYTSKGSKLGAKATAFAAAPGVEIAASKPVKKLVSKIMPTPKIFERDAYAGKGNMRSKDLGEFGYSDDALKLFEQAGIDPANYQSNTAKQVINQTLAAEGFSPQALKTAAVRVGMLPEQATAEQIASVTASKATKPTHAMLQGEPHPRGGVGPQVQKNLNTAVEEQIAAQKAAAEEAAAGYYGRAASETGEFTSPDFSTGLKDAINKALVESNHPSIDEIVNSPGYDYTRQMLLGKSEKGLKTQGLLDRLSGWSPGSAVPTEIKPTAVDFGPIGKYTYEGGTWRSPAGIEAKGELANTLTQIAEEQGKLPKPVVPTTVAPPTIKSVSAAVDPTNFFKPGELGSKSVDVNAAYTIRDAAERFMQDQAANYSGDVERGLGSAITGRGYSRYALGSDASGLPAEWQPRVGQLETAKGIINSPDTSMVIPEAGDLKQPGIAQKLLVRAASAAGAHVNPFLAIPAQHVIEDVFAPKSPMEYRRYPKAPITVPTSVQTGLQGMAVANTQPSAPVPTSVQMQPQPQAQQGPSDAELQKAWEAEFSKRPQQATQSPRAQTDEELSKAWEAQFGQPQSTGGRAAYKSGGKVGGDIEPLVRNLITKAKMAKKVSDKATEPLLNAHDDAIASALATAQKAI